jgi:hypothetical protein
MIQKQNTQKPKRWLKVSVSAFILLLFLPNIGISLYSNYQISKVRKEMKTKLKQGAPAALLQTMTFSKDQFKHLYWTKANKEYKIKGKLYDVVFKKIIQNKIEVICISDTNEDILFVKLDKLVKNEAIKKGILLKINPLVFTCEMFMDNIGVPKNIIAYRADFFHFHQHQTVGINSQDLRPPTI